MSTSPSAQRIAGTRRSATIVRAIITVALVGVFVLLAYLGVQWFGVVEGIEFSPDTFAQRRFYYLELPLLRARISAVYHEEISGPLERRVRAQPKLFPPATVQPPRWHLVSMKRGRREYTDDAQIVCRYFDHEGDTARRWLEWNRKHAKLAEILWPAIVQVCRGELYSFVPELFATAERLTTNAVGPPAAEEFRAAIGESLAGQYVRLANAEQGLEEHGRAVQFYTLALQSDTNDIAALRGRAFSHTALGDAAKANADRAAVKRLERAAR